MHIAIGPTLAIVSLLTRFPRGEVHGVPVVDPGPDPALEIHDIVESTGA